MPTRALGDFRLKYREFNEHPYNGQREYRVALQNYNGPYITHKPDIMVHTIEKNDKYLVIASDGLWDELKLAEVRDIFELNKDAQVDHSKM